MGREIRMVPPNYEHPKKTVINHLYKTEERFVPQFDKLYEEACEEWKTSFAKFYAEKKDKESKCEFWEWEGSPPKREEYRSYRDSEATWFCLYETVSEGTPVTPPFATKEELANYLAENGDFWDQERRRQGDFFMDCKPWGRDAAYRFVFGGGYMPSMVIVSGKILTGGELAAEMNQKVTNDPI